MLTTIKGWFGKKNVKEVNLYERMVEDFFKANAEVEEVENRLEKLEGTNFTDAVILELSAKRAMRSAILNQIRQYTPTEQEHKNATTKNFASCIEMHDVA